MPGHRFRWITYEVDVHPRSLLASPAETSRAAAASLADAVKAQIDLPDLSGYLSPREKAEALLTVAAEIEHALLVQYLYAAYLLKNANDQTLSSEQKKAVANWRRTIRDIAEEEMGHLMTVQNLRRVIGLGPTFARDEFPILDLFPFAFHLGPLTQKTLAEYVVAESPTNDTTHPALPEIIKVATGDGAMPVNHVGILYGLLGVIFAASPKDIISDASGQDPWYTMVRDIAIAAYQQNASEGAWHLSGGQFDPTTLPMQASANDFGVIPGAVLPPPPEGEPPQIRVWQCANRDDAKEALRDIGLQGEGAAQPPPSEEGSHFERFYAIYTGDDQQLPFPKDQWVPTYSAPTDPVISNDATDPSAISEPKAQAYAILADLRYALVLGLLNQYLVTDPIHRATLMFANFTLANWAVNEMVGLSELAPTLAGLPRSKAGPDKGNAALPFTLPGVLTPPVAQAEQWDLLIQRLQAIIDQEAAIIKTYNDASLKAISDTHIAQLKALKQQNQLTQAPSGLKKKPEELAFTFMDVQTILENAVNGDDIGKHGNFWRTSLDNFKTLVLFKGTPREKQVLVVGDGENSNLIKALRGNPPFDGTYAPQMPDGYPPVPSDKIDQISQWIDHGCH